ncbi:hypothetical protein K2173_010202 [Erythroxylum novogranatense]|uniref:Uncharacterized protein n=1 Tax=Erythroxylum novogranatense TaxID=1862640 RepID=A0AAV8SQP4_9ROSI|nr:hypothetical protein K2173_010202 [Erythroxylum novogranatense]
MQCTQPDSESQLLCYSPQGLDRLIPITKDITQSIVSEVIQDLMGTLDRGLGSNRRSSIVLISSQALPHSKAVKERGRKDDCAGMIMKHVHAKISITTVPSHG